jgi:hypothetical protein
LKETGLVEGENVIVIYRWAEDRGGRLPEMASELARQANVIITAGGLLRHSRPKGKVLDLLGIWRGASFA